MYSYLFPFSNLFRRKTAKNRKRGKANARKISQNHNINHHSTFPYLSASLLVRVVLSGDVGAILISFIINYRWTLRLKNLQITYDQISG